MTVPVSADPPRFGVLAVCTGNICRSPAVEVRLRNSLGAASDVVVSSAGLSARVGEPVEPAMVRLLGTASDGFRARQVTAESVRAAGLVLTMTRDQRAALVTRFPAAVRRAFTLREFTDLAALATAAGVSPPAGSPGAVLEELVRAAPRFRAGRVGQDDDIEDPYGQDEAVFVRVHDAIHVAVRTLTGLLPVTPARPG